MGSRLWPRLLVGLSVLPHLPLKFLRKPISAPRSILVAHHLLLGDTIMLAPLLKKLRRQFPSARIDMLCPTAYLPLFAGQPYGVRALAYNPRSLRNHLQLLRNGPYDLALIAGDNRCAWIARAMGAHWIRAFAADQSTYKEWPIDEWVAWPMTSHAWGDIAPLLIEGKAVCGFVAGEWPAPPRGAMPSPELANMVKPYCVIHVGASSAHKHWPPENWNALMAHIRGAGYVIAISGGANETALVRALKLQPDDIDLCGRMNLAQLWHVLANAAFVVCPDTGVAHLARLTNTPTVALFGPGSPIVSGPGEFWKDSPFETVSIDIACRDQNLLFERRIEWVRQCWRGVSECGNPRCMQGIGVPNVIDALRKMDIRL